MSEHGRGVSRRSWGVGDVSKSRECARVCQERCHLSIGIDNGGKCYFFGTCIRKNIGKSIVWRQFFVMG